LYVYLPIVMAVLVAGCRKLAGWTPAMARPDWRLILVLVVWYIVPVGGAWLATSTDTARLLFPRYVIAASLVPVLAAGMACATGAGRWSRVGLAVLISMAAVAAEWSGYHFGPVRSCLARGHCSTRGSEDWRGVVQYLNAVPVGKDHPIFVQPSLIEADDLSPSDDGSLAAYCLFPVTSKIYPLDTRNRLVQPLRTREALLPDLGALDTVIERGGVWLVVRGTEKWAKVTVGRLDELLRHRGGRIHGVRRVPFTGVYVVHLDVRSTDGAAIGGEDI
jgi:hypothetical protein